MADTRTPTSRPIGAEEATGEPVVRHAPPGSRSELLLDVFPSFAGLESIRGEWDEFVEGVGGDLFSSFDWCDTWWRHYGSGRRLHIHVVRDASGGKLVAILPMFSERIRVGPFTLRAIRLVGCDHSVTTAAPAIEATRLPDVLPVVVERLVRDGAWDVLHLGPLPGYYVGIDDLVSAVRSASAISSVDLRPGHPHMWFDVPESFEAFLEHLSTKERRNVRRDERKLEQRGAVSRDLVENQAGLAESFDRFVEMHQRHWRSLGCLGHFADWPDALAFHRDMVERQHAQGRLLLSRVRVGGETDASEYSYRFGKRVHWILTARREGVPGRLGFCGLVRHACEAGLTRIDAMRGFYEYKRLLGAEMAPQSSIVAVRGGTMPLLRYKMMRLAAWALDVAYYRVYFSRLASKLPRTPAPLWRSWIRSRL